MKLSAMILRNSWTQIQTFVSVLLVILIVHQAILSTTNPSDFHALSSHRSWGVDVCGYPLDQDPRKAHGCILQNENHEGRTVQGVEGYQHCLFFRENFDMAFCAVEKGTHDVVRKVIEPDDVVLEIGSRWDFKISTILQIT